jgi:hypothetical protein
MLSSRDTRFSWSKQDRSLGVPFFRALAHKWRPTVSKRDSEAGTNKSSATSLNGKRTARRVWTPWLWVE